MKKLFDVVIAFLFLAGGIFISQIKVLAAEDPSTLKGTWTLLSKTQPLGHTYLPADVVLDREGQLYVTDGEDGGRIQKRDRDGHWTLFASSGKSPEALKNYRSIVFDTAGCLYVIESERIRKRDLQGNWTTVASKGKELGQSNYLSCITLDREDNLYVAESGEEARIQLRKADGQWSLLAGSGTNIDQSANPYAMAIDGGTLYVADSQQFRQRDSKGRWSMVAVDEKAVGKLAYPGWLKTDASGVLYVGGYSENNKSLLLKRDSEGRWSELAVEGSEPGKQKYAVSLTVDPTGVLYLADSGNNRIQKRETNGTWTVVCAALTGPGYFVETTDVAVDSRGNVYVSDAEGKQVQRRDPKGRWTVLGDAHTP
jgi:sugar lactone lactonase YvrE